MNLLAAIDGIKYANKVQGASNSIKFLSFFNVAFHMIDPKPSRPVLEVGDIIVVDNFAAHQGEAKHFTPPWTT